MPEALISLIAIAAAVVAVDQGSKAAVRGALGDRTLSLGILGDVRVVERHGNELSAGARSGREQRLGEVARARFLAGGVEQETARRVDAQR